MADTAAKSKNWLLVKFRQYHTWLGVGLSLFIIVICLTGIYLNHKGLFNSLVGKSESEHTEEHKQDKPKRKPGDKLHSDKAIHPKLAESSKMDQLLMTSNPSSLAVAMVVGTDEINSQSRQPEQFLTSRSLTAYPIGFDQALNQARNHWNDDAVELEKIELRSEDGEMVYKIKDLEEREVIINAKTGKLTEKKPQQDWGKTLKDLHTGKIGGTTGKLLVDFTSIVMLFLTGSGIYLWLAPMLRKRNKTEKPAEPNSTKPLTVSNKSNELLEKLRAKKAAATASKNPANV